MAASIANKACSVQSLCAEDWQHCLSFFGCAVACRALCGDLAPCSARLVDAFGIPDHLVAAPIATNWERYNEVDNRGELLGQQFA